MNTNRSVKIVSSRFNKKCIPFMLTVRMIVIIIYIYIYKIKCTINKYIWNYIYVLQFNIFSMICCCCIIFVIRFFVASTTTSILAMFQPLAYKHQVSISSSLELLKDSTTNKLKKETNTSISYNIKIHKHMQFLLDNNQWYIFTFISSKLIFWP